MVRHFINLFLWFLPPTRLFWLRRICLRMGGIELASGAKICGRGWIYGRGILRVGAESWLSPGVTIYTHLEAVISVGARCDIGPGVELITGGHEIGGATRRAGTGTARPIQIGDGCWVGAGARILGGVSVGKGAVIAAGALVFRDVAPNTLVAGVPAIQRKSLA